jgi:hypothetical protein
VKHDLEAKESGRAGTEWSESDTLLAHTDDANLLGEIIKHILSFSLSLSVARLPKWGLGLLILKFRNFYLDTR